MKHVYPLQILALALCGAGRADAGIPIEQLFKGAFDPPTAGTCVNTGPKNTGRLPLFFPGDETFETGASNFHYFPSGEDPLATLAFSSCQLDVAEVHYDTPAHNPIARRNEYRTYDSAGRIALESIDEDGNSSIDVRSTYSYNAKGDVSRIEVDADGDGIADREDRYTYLYEGSSSRINSIAVALDDDLDAGDGAPTTISVLLGYHASNGLLLTEAWQVVSPGQTTTMSGLYTYEANGALATYTLDYTLPTLIPTARYLFQWTANNDLLSLDQELLHGTSGVLLSRVAYDFSYDSSCRMSSRTRDENTLTGDGVDATLNVEYDANHQQVAVQDEVVTEPGEDGCHGRSEWIWYAPGKPRGGFFDGRDYSLDSSQSCSLLDGRSDRELHFSGSCVH